MLMNKKFFIALGGSIVAPEKLDIVYLKQLKSFLEKQTRKGNKFVIVVGGGFVCRNYVKSALKIKKLSLVEQDWLGIAATRFNAFFLKTILGGLACPKIFDRPDKIKGFGKYSVIVGCGWEPGWSTDYIALKIAFAFKQKTGIIMGKPDYIYTKDPDIYKRAEPIKEMALTNYLKMIPKKWQPCLSLPIDPIAAKFANDNKMKVLVIGKDLKNLEKIIDNKSFIGTVCF